MDKLLTILILLACTASAQEGPSLSGGENVVDVTIRNDYYLTSEAIGLGVSWGNVVGDYTNSSGIVSANGTDFGDDMSKYLGGNWSGDLSPQQLDWSSDYIQSAPLAMMGQLNYDNIREFADTTDFGQFFAPSDTVGATNAIVFAGFSNRFNTATGYEFGYLSTNVFGSIPQVNWREVYLNFSLFGHGLPNVTLPNYPYLWSMLDMLMIVVRAFALYFAYVGLWRYVKDMFN